MTKDTINWAKQQPKEQEKIFKNYTSVNGEYLKDIKN